MEHRQEQKGHSSCKVETVETQVVQLFTPIAGDEVPTKLSHPHSNPIIITRTMAIVIMIVIVIVIVIVVVRVLVIVRVIVIVITIY